MSVYQSFKSFILISAFMCFFGAFVSASNTHAQMLTSAAPQFMPVGGWSVEKTAFAQTQGLVGVRLPCMMATSFDNGFILRFSGHGGQMLAMAIDFRQDVFTQGRKYPANVGFNQGAGYNVTATAFSESTLIFNLRPILGFYQQMQGASALTLNVDGNAFAFGLGNTPEAISRLESCFGPSSMPAVNMPMAVSEPPKPAMKDWNEKVSPVVPSSTSPAMMTWQARAGDDMRATLERWSSQAGVALQWQSDRSGQVVGDINLSGSFAEAVQLLMAQNATALGIDANMGGVSAPQIVSPSMPQSITPMASIPEPVEQSPSGVGRWNAPAGANLQLVLEKWSKDLGVAFVWQSHHEFILKRPVDTSNSYESALQSVLGQFSNDKIRPAAQLNNDPETGQRILIVKSTRVL